MESLHSCQTIIDLEKCHHLLVALLDGHAGRFWRVGFSLCQTILFFMCIKICEDFRNQRSGNQFLLLTSYKHQPFRSLNLWHLSPTRHWKVVAPPPRKSTERSGWWTLGSFVLRDLKETQVVEQRWPLLEVFITSMRSYSCVPHGDIILVYHNCHQSFVSMLFGWCGAISYCLPIHPSTWDRVVATELIAAPAGRRHASGWWADRKRTCRKKLYQHRPQIAKNNFCVINVKKMRPPQP